MVKVTRSQLLRYGVAVFSVVLALLLTLLFHSLLVPSVFVLFFAAVAISSWYGGIKPGLLATVLSALAINYFFVAPFYSLKIADLDDMVRLGVFVLVTLLIGSLNSELRTAKQRTEAALAKLQASEQHYRRLLDTAHEGIWTLDAEGRTNYVNQRMARMLGYSVEEMRDRSFFDFIDPVSRTQAQQKWNHRQQGIAEQHDFQFRCKEGSLLWTIVSTNPIVSATGEFKGALAMITDVSERQAALRERKRTENALKESQAMFEAFMSHIPATAFIKDEAGRYVYFNPLAERLSKLKLADCLGKTDFDLFPAEIAQQWWENDLKVLNAGEMLQTVEPIVLEDGEYYWMSFKFPFIDASGQKMLAGMSIDISDRKRLEDQLRHSEARFKCLVDANIIGVILADMNQIKEANEIFLQMVGYSQEELLSGKVCWQDMTPPEYSHLDEKALQELQATGVCTPFEKEFIRKDSSRVPILIGAALFQPSPLTWICFVLDLTQRKQADAALRESEARYRLLFESNPHPMWVFDLETLAFLAVNQAAIAHYGYSETEFLQMTIADIRPPEDVPALRQILSTVTTGYKDNKTWKHRKKDGTIIDVEVITHTLFFDGKRANLALANDITERKRTEAALRESESRFRRLFESNMIGVIFWDTRGNITKANDAFLDMVGYTREDLIAGKVRWDKMTPPEYRYLDERGLEILQKTGISPPFEKDYIRKDGSRVPVFLGSAFFEGSQENGISFVLDLSNLKQAQAALRQSEERFRVAQELSLDGFTTLQSVRDATGKIIDFEWTYVNPKGAEMLHHKAEALIGQRLLQILPGNKFNSELFDRYVQVVETGVPHDIEIYYDAEGITGWFRNMAVKLGDGVAISFSDITKRKQIEVERLALLKREQAARNAAETASRTKDEFLAIVSHELRSPLNAILGWSRLLRTRNFNPETTSRALETIERNAQAQTQLIEDLLDISRIIRGKIRLYARPTNLVSVIEAAIDTILPTADTKGIQLTFNIESTSEDSNFSPSPILVSGDPDRLQQVIWNLLSNAVKFTPEGGKVEIKLSTIAGHKEKQLPITNSAQIKVIDTGKGISPDFLPYVFERFRQADSTTTRSYGGLGLGLAIVRNLVELHGGTVQVESQGENQGSTFMVQLPRLKDESGTITDESEIHSSLLPNSASLSINGLRILIVDDEPDTREFLVTSLEQYGAKITAAASAKEAMQLLETWQLDILISDIGMPVEDGYSLMRRIRALPAEKGGKVRAIALTAYAREEDRIRAISAGFHMHVSKPIDPLHLVAVVANLAESSR